MVALSTKKAVTPPWNMLYCWSRSGRLVTGKLHRPGEGCQLGLDQPHEALCRKVRSDGQGDLLERRIGRKGCELAVIGVP